MGWRLQIAEQPVTALAFLPGEPTLLAAWTSPQDVFFYDAHTGAAYDPVRIALPPQVGPGGSGWRTYLETLRAPNGAYLPVVDAGLITIYLSHDGRLRLYWYSDDRLVLDIDNQLVPLTRENQAAWLAVGLDREIGMVCALDDRGFMHIYQQQIPVGTYPVEGSLGGGQVALLLADATDRIVLRTDTELQALDVHGRVLHRMAFEGAFGGVGCAPDGHVLAVGEVDHERITTLDATLQPVRRGAIVDLMANAAPVQLFEQTVYWTEPMLPLAVAEQTLLAFAVGGMVCVVAQEALDALPRPRLLL